MRIRPSDVKAVVAMLDQEHDDVTELAKQVIRLITDRITERSELVVLVECVAYGPYTTVKEASKRVGDPLMATRPGVRGAIAPLRRDFEWSDDDE